MHLSFALLAYTIFRGDNQLPASRYLRLLPSGEMKNRATSKERTDSYTEHLTDGFKEYRKIQVRKRKLIDQLLILLVNVTRKYYTTLSVQSKLDKSLLLVKIKNWLFSKTRKPHSSQSPLLTLVSPFSQSES